MFSVLVIRLRSLRLLRVSGIVMRLRMFLLLITFLKASHSFRNRLLVICKNAYLFATMIMTSVSSPFSCCSGIVRLKDRKSGSAGMPRPISYAVFCLKKKMGDAGADAAYGRRFLKRPSADDDASGAWLQQTEEAAHQRLLSVS